MAEITCLKNSETKKYIIPTDTWLEPLNPLITNLSSRGKLILARMANKNKVIVKITKNLDLFRIKYISHIVQKIPNFPKVYCVFECNEDESNFNTNYLNINGFCHEKSDKFKIILEIMKLYPNKISEYNNKLNIQQIKPILKQLIFGLMYAFELTGFIHGDLHIENILINKFEEEKELTYIIKHKTFKIKTKEEYIILDFDKSITYDKTYMSLPFFTESNTLIYSIKKIISVCAILFKKEKKYEQDPLNIALDRGLRKIHYDMVDQGISILTSYYQESRNYTEFREESINDVITFVNLFWKELYNEYLFPNKYNK